jgi:hypothetical protein
VELLGKLRDRSVCAPELLQNTASGGVRERGERGIEVVLSILNHLVQYLNIRIRGVQVDAERGCVAGRLRLQIEISASALITVEHVRQHVRCDATPNLAHE